MAVTALNDDADVAWNGYVATAARYDANSELSRCGHDGSKWSYDAAASRCGHVL